VKSIDGQIFRILLALKQCCVHARGLFIAVDDFQFHLGLQVLKFIFLLTNPLTPYLLGKEIDIATAHEHRLELFLLQETTGLWKTSLLFGMFGKHSKVFKTAVDKP